MTEEDKPDLHAVGDRIARLLEELRSSAEGRVWLRVEELVRLLTELYGAGLARTLELAGPGDELLTRLAGDELVGSLMVLHDLHPEPLETRVGRAVASLAPRLGKGDARVEVTSIDPDASSVVLTVTAPGGGCGSTGTAVQETVRQAVADAAPDADVEVRLAADLTPAPTPVRLGRKPVAASHAP
ncbi:MAG: NifU family protein [Acidimicrobiales bacterium]